MLEPADGGARQTLCPGAQTAFWRQPGS